MSRFLLPALVACAFTLSFTAFAADEKPADKAAQSVPASITPAPYMPPAPKPDPNAKIDEPNLKVLKGSAGMIKSSLVSDAPLSSDYVLGDRKAPLVMIEYVSMSCPHCAHFSNTVIPDLQKKYFDTGKVAYVLRQFPLNEPALKAAMLLDCVGQQDPARYYVFAKVLFDAQSKWAFDNNWMQGLETIASVGGLNREQFQRCVVNTDREVKVLNAKKTANDELKVPHTPYFIINGEVFEGDRTVEGISQFIDAKLEKQKNRTLLDKVLP